MELFTILLDNYSCINTDNSYYGIYTSVQADTFIRFNKIMMVFMNLIEQFDFDLSILHKSRIIYHMIECDIKVFRNLLK